MRFVQKNKTLKCKKCGQKKDNIITDTLKKINICTDCFEEYKKAKVHCTVCRSSFSREKEYYNEDSKWRSKNFCSEKCYSEYYQEQEEKDKMTEWLKKHYKTENLPTRIFMQMEDFKTKRNISYRWCFVTLRYIVDVKQQSLQEGTIGLVPYMIDECKEYVASVNRTKKLAKESDKYKTRFTNEVVIIHETNIEKQREKYINKKIIKESDLEGVILW